MAMADQLVRGGGIITLPGLPLERHLVGHFEWVGESAAFMFPAFGERTTDGRLVAFTDITLSTTGLCFLHGTLIAGYLCAIDKAALADPDDHRVAWRLWQEVRPRQRKLIERAREHCIAAAAARERVTPFSARAPAGRAAALPVGATVVDPT